MKMSFESALSLLRQDKNSSNDSKAILCQPLDRILSGGIHCGNVTEISGESGCGKTQLMFQLCVNVQIPQELGGIGGEAVYIDTECTFSSDRIIQIASAIIGQHQHSFKKTKTPSFDAKTILSRIYYFKCLCSVELVAVMHQMENFLKAHRRVKLIVVDSITQTLRGDEDFIQRNQVLNIIALKFRQIVYHHKIALVYSNQVTWRLDANGSSVIVPALGRTWSHVAETKLMLSKVGAKGVALLYKSCSHPRATAGYTISSKGFQHENASDSPGKDCTLSRTEVDKALTSANVASQLIHQDFIDLSQNLLTQSNCSQAQERFENDLYHNCGAASSKTTTEVCYDAQKTEDDCSTSVEDKAPLSPVLMKSKRYKKRKF